MKTKTLETFYLNQIETAVDRMLAEGNSHLSTEEVDSRYELLRKWNDQVARHLRSEFRKVVGDKK